MEMKAVGRHRLYVGVKEGPQGVLLGRRTGGGNSGDISRLLYFHGVIEEDEGFPVLLFGTGGGKYDVVVRSVVWSVVWSLPAVVSVRGVSVSVRVCVCVCAVSLWCCRRHCQRHCQRHRQRHRQGDEAIVWENIRSTPEQRRRERRRHSDKCTHRQGREEALPLGRPPDSGLFLLGSHHGSTTTYRTVGVLTIRVRLGVKATGPPSQSNLSLLRFDYLTVREAVAVATSVLSCTFSSQSFGVIFWSHTSIL
jgi:hypothetical protein